MGDWHGTDRLADEPDVLSLDVLHDHDLLLGEEMEGELVDGVAQNGLLDEDDVSARLDDLGDHLGDVLPFLDKDPIDLVVIPDLHRVLDISLGGRQAELDDRDLGLLHLPWAAGLLGGLLVREDNAVDELGVVDGASLLLDDVDIAEIDVVVDSWIDDLQNGVYSDRGELLGTGGHDFGCERGHDALDEGVAVGELHWLRHLIKDLQ